MRELTKIIKSLDDVVAFLPKGILVQAMLCEAVHLLRLRFRFCLAVEMSNEPASILCSKERLGTRRSRQNVAKPEKAGLVVRARTGLGVFGKRTAIRKEGSER
jgi:hypothetical protein